MQWRRIGIHCLLIAVLTGSICAGNGEAGRSFFFQTEDGEPAENNNQSNGAGGDFFITVIPTLSPVEANGAAESDPAFGLMTQPVYMSAYVKPLSKGDRGEQVASLQKTLIALGYLASSADGDYGKKTEEAVRWAQSQVRLPETGIADAAFLTELYVGRIPNAAGSYVQLPPQVICSGETSHHTEKAGAYPVGNVFDGKKNTCWAEGASGYGIGEGINFTVATFGRSSITLTIYSGYHKSSRRYYQNARPKDITLYVNGVAQTHRFDDRMSPEAVTISGLDGSAFVDFRISIDSVYEGSKWKDTCISEIEIF